eukprot:1136328-Pelagomonas_calceolata.AAC.1
MHAHSLLHSPDKGTQHRVQASALAVPSTSSSSTTTTTTTAISSKWATKSVISRGMHSQLTVGQVLHKVGKAQPQLSCVSNAR